MQNGLIGGALAEVELLPHGRVQSAHVVASRGRRVEPKMQGPLLLDSAVRIQVAEMTYLAEVYCCRADRKEFIILADVQHAFSEQDLPAVWLDIARAAAP